MKRELIGEGVNYEVGWTAVLDGKGRGEPPFIGHFLGINCVSVERVHRRDLNVLRDNPREKRAAGGRLVGLCPAREGGKALP